MSLAWFRPHDVSQWVSKSACGYYAVSKSPADTDSVRRYEAHHIEALWAMPAAIGWGSTIDAAQRVCEQHRAGKLKPA